MSNRPVAEFLDSQRICGSDMGGCPVPSCSMQNQQTHAISIRRSYVPSLVAIQHPGYSYSRPKHLTHWKVKLMVIQ
jgi:hypothetical protein